jgi:hypothetical protein
MNMGFGFKDRCKLGLSESHSTIISVLVAGLIQQLRKPEAIDIEFERTPHRDRFS